ncbi:MAG: SGNH/GDSL hydrolase family protein [Pirellulaceae bacterium]|nr:SGNH/GDSL hydrolase family protein [Pirellulaceae bacterium]
MGGLIFLFGSGWAFFVGAAMALAGVTALPWLVGGKASAARIVALLGLAVTALSAAPLSLWWYATASVLLIASLFARQRSGPVDGARRGPSALWWGTLAIWLGGMALELPYQFSPRVPPLNGPPLYIVGDSITAGVGAGDGPTWPRRLPDRVAVGDYSRMGATAASALKNCRDLPPKGLVLVEIGGNDLLGDTAAAAFERDLDRLLMHVGPGRTVLMFELPLPPLANEYGRIQRRLAAKHGVQLIPKRVLMGVLSGGGATLDSVHLSSAGHQQMADRVWEMIAPAYD